MKSKLADNLMIAGIKTLLDDEPLYGYIVMNLVRETDVNTSNALQLKWQNHQWCLIVNPNLIASQYTTHSQVALALAHEALHMIWQHPLRYSQQREKAVDLGTDVAVNQYLPKDLGQLPNAVTVETILMLYGKLLAPYQDSQVYIAAIKKLVADSEPQQSVDDSNHKSWDSVGTAVDEARAALTTVIRHAHNETVQLGRGQIPATIQQQINAIIVPKKSWRSILRTGLSQIPERRQSSRARFNRRQAYRLDLAGEISQSMPQLAIFIDQSASISNTCASIMLAQVLQIAKQFDANVEIFAFDTQVYEIKKIKAWVRRSGGGTTFQCVFDELALRRFNPSQTSVVILTDGDGEKTKLRTRFKHVYWLLPNQAKLSIQSPFGIVMHLDDVKEMNSG